MNKSESITELAAALAEFQASMPMVPKLHTGKIEGVARGSGKAYSYEYQYSDMGDVVDASRPHLADAGLSVVQMVEHDEDGHLLTTMILHKSGQWIEGAMRLMLPESATPQTQGSAITYAKRYAYCAALGIVADTDDDGTLAMAAYGEGSGRVRRPPRSTSTRQSAASQPIQGRDASTEGELAMSAGDRNKIVKYFAHETPPITKPGEIVAEVNKVLRRNEAGPVEALVKLSASNGALLFAELGIEP